MVLSNIEGTNKVGKAHMKNPQKGSRIILQSTSDPYTSLRPGSKGTVIFVDDTGTVHVKWDNGETLGLLPDEDRFKII
jgi:hypothetical protein